SSRLSVVPMSRNSGTFSSDTTSEVSRLAQRMGSAAFLAPEIETSPASGFPPRMTSLAIGLRLILCRRQRAHRQGMDFCFHTFAQGGVHDLVTRDQTLAFKGGAYDQRFKMGAIANHFKHFAFKVVGNVLTYDLR